MTAHDAPSALPIVVRGLTKAYGGRVVVDGLDFEVEDGQMVGMIGANGAGKTTTVESVQGLRRPDAGHIRVLGLDPLREADRLRPQIGSQLQSAGLPDRLRVGEAITLFAGSRARGSDQLLEQFGLADRRRSPFAGLSGGERQRLFLILALLNRPRLVILDELTQGLDPAARRDVWDAVAQLRDDGTTVLLVTHELDEIEALCERVIVMRDGRIVDQGRPAALVSRHGGPATVRFTLAHGADASDSQAQEQIAGLPGVDTAERSGRQMVVRGSRQCIAHLGAWLVARSDPLPEDLHVTVPGLEDALMTLLVRPDRQLKERVE